MIDQFSQHISATLKSLRKQQGWSLDKTAEETGVSKAMLGQIERQESSPTITTLWKIASGFHKSFSYFLEELDNDFAHPKHREGKTQHLHPSNDKILVASLFPFDEQLHCEIFKIDLLPGCTHLSPPHQTGVIKHVIVVTGSMEVLINDHWHPLKTAEGLRFDAHQPHGYRNLTDQIAVIHDIIHYPQ